MVVPVPRGSIGGVLAIIVLCGIFSAFNSSKSTQKSTAAARPTFEPAKFNDALVNHKKHSEFVQAYKAFLSQADLVAEGRASSAELRKSQERVIRLIDDLVAETKAVQVPDSKTARDFYQAYLTLRTNRGEWVKTAMAEILNTVESPGLSAQARIAGIDQSWNRVVALEKADLQAMLTAQKAFAGEHRLTLLPNMPGSF